MVTALRLVEGGGQGKGMVKAAAEDERGSMARDYGISIALATIVA